MAIPIGYGAPKNPDGKLAAGTPLHETLKILKGKYPDIPLASKWRADTKAALAAPLIDAEICPLLDRYHHPGLNKFTKAFIANDLMVALEDWMKLPQHLGGTAASQKRQQLRQQLTYDLYKIVIAKLCVFFECHVNVLPDRLKQAFVEMKHSRPNEGVSYLGDVAREQCRLNIQEGKFWGWGNGGEVFGPVNTDDPEFAAMNHGFVEGDLECEAGFVLSPWRAIYMRKHGMAIDSYHSQYMAGQQVLTAGEMTIKDGVLRKISNASGHYQPSPETLLPLLWILAGKDVQLGNVRLLAFESSGLGDRMYGSDWPAADEFLAKNGSATERVSHWLENPRETWERLCSVTGRVTFPVGTRPEDHKIAFESIADRDLICESKINADGTFSLGTLVSQGARKRFVQGSPPRNDYGVVVVVLTNQHLWDLGIHSVLPNQAQAFNFVLNFPHQPIPPRPLL